MNKPQDFDNVQEYGNFIPLPPGGYVCRILRVEETTAQSSGAPMLKIGLEIEEGEYKGYYRRSFDEDTRRDKKWPCIVNQLVYDTNGSNTTNRGFKTFVTAVQKSNPGFTVQWGPNFAACFKNKVVGGVFRREQYKAQDGKLRFSTKCAWFRSVDEIRKGIDVPEDKLIADNNQNKGYSSGYSPNVDVPYDDPFAPPQQNAAPQANAPLPDTLADFEEVISDSNLPF